MTRTSSKENKINKAEIIRSVAKKNDIKLYVAKKLFDDFFNEIGDRVIKGNSVGIDGFGLFYPREHTGRKIANPNTGEEIFVPTVTTMGFKPGKPIKDALKEADKNKGKY